MSCPSLFLFFKLYEKDPKRRIKKQNAEKISWFFFNLFIQFKKKEKERDRTFKAVSRDAKKNDFLKGHYFLMKSTRKRTPFQSKMV